MIPAVPPLPTPWNLPFQLAIGSQTSNVTAGALTATTRQNAGRLRIAVVPSGGVNAGPGTSSADLIVVSGSRSLARFAHAPDAGAVTRGAAASPAVARSAAAAEHVSSLFIVARLYRRLDTGPAFGCTTT